MSRVRFHEALKPADVHLQRNGAKAVFKPGKGSKYLCALGAAPLICDESGTYAFEVVFDVEPGSTSLGRSVERWEPWIFRYVEVGIVLRHELDVDIAQALKKKQICCSLSVCGGGNFYIAKSWNKSIKLDIQDWAGLSYGDRLGIEVVTAQGETIAFATVNGSRVGQSVNLADLVGAMGPLVKFWPLLESHTSLVSATFVNGQSLPMKHEQIGGDAESCGDWSCKKRRQALETSNSLCAQARAGNVSALRKQLEELPADVDLAPQLCIAAGFGRVDYVRILLEYRVSPDWPSSSVGAQRNALHEACLWPEGEPVVALLLEHRANPNLTAKLNSKTMNAYQMALHKRNAGAADMIECATAHTLPNLHTLGTLRYLGYRCGSGEGVWSSAETRLRTKQSNKSDGSEAEDTPELVYIYIYLCVLLYCSHILLDICFTTYICIFCIMIPKSFQILLLHPITPNPHGPCPSRGENPIARTCEKNTIA